MVERERGEVNDAKGDTNEVIAMQRRQSVQKLRS